MSKPSVTIVPTLRIPCVFSEVDADELPEATAQGGHILAVFFDDHGDARYLVATPAAREAQS